MEYFYSLPEHPVISVASSATPTKKLSSKPKFQIQKNKEIKGTRSSPRCRHFWSTWPQKIKLFVAWWKKGKETFIAKTDGLKRK